MILTNQILNKGKSDNGSWSRKQLRSLGLKWPLKHGWKRRIIGRDIPKENIEQFLKLKNAHLRLKAEDLFEDETFKEFRRTTEGLKG